jgi:hypothetical protein
VRLVIRINETRIVWTRYHIKQWNIQDIKNSTGASLYGVFTHGVLNRAVPEKRGEFVTFVNTLCRGGRFFG